MHDNRTVAWDATAKSVLTVRNGPMLSVNDTDVPPGTLTAEHDTDDGDTVNDS